MPAYASIFVNFFPNPCQGRSRILNSFFDPPPSYELHTEDPLDVNTVPFECCVAVKKNDVWFAEEDEEENDGC